MVHMNGMGSMKAASVRLFVTLAVMIATLSSGFAHQAPDLDPRQFLRAPDGGAMVYCLTDPSEEHGHGHAAACDACVLAGAAVLPVPGTAAEPAAHGLSAPFAVVPTDAPQGAGAEYPRQRGPPVPV
ncbi:MAG: hypothetical protein ACPGID_05755 [Rubricella sp.]